jgi:hypothetical protein
MSAGVVCKLHVSNSRKVPLDGGTEFAFHPLGVIDVVLYECVICADIIQDINRLPSGV